MAKNIIICCDGTGNEIKTELSNVLKLVRVAKKSTDQIVYYDPGIGTFGAGRSWLRIKHWLKKVFNLSVGRGLDQNVMEAYSFLIDHYEDGDQIYLFGFSRGAYTVRVLAGLLRTIGLISPHQKNLVAYGLQGYKAVSDHGDNKPAEQKFANADLFHKIARGKYVPIKYVGVWDTVSSVIVRRLDIFRPISMLQLPYTAKNSSVEVFRHAIAIDERRRMFRVNHWTPDQEFKTNPFAPESKPQDIDQVWFAGVHSDVGGGYPEADSGLSKFPLAWMINEAEKHGLQIHKQTFNRLVLGEGENNNKYVEPDAGAKIHKSLTLGWWITEILPKRKKWREWSNRWAVLVFWYFPLAEPRKIENGANIHGSVLKRVETVSGYDPINLPEEYNIVD